MIAIFILSVVAVVLLVLWNLPDARAEHKKLNQDLKRINVDGLYGIGFGVLFVILGSLVPSFMEYLFIPWGLPFLPLLFVGFGFAMSNPGVIDTIIFYSIVIIISGALYFIAGVIIGGFYRNIIKPRGGPVIFTFFILIALLSFGSVYYQTPVSYTGQTALSCRQFSLSHLKMNFKVNNCLNEVAVKANTVAACQQLAIENGRYDCIYEVYRSTGDQTACEQLPLTDRHRSDCISDSARKKMDYKVCDSLSDPQQKKECISDVAWTKGECSILDAQDANACYSSMDEDIRVYARDNQCDSFKSPLYVQQCKNFRKGMITLEQLCKNITDPKLELECVNENINGIQVNYSTGETTIYNTSQ